MGKISAKAAQELLDAGSLTKEGINELEEKNMVSKKRKSLAKYIKTADNKYVQLMLYFRGGKGVKNSEDMDNLTSDFNKLLDKYATTNKNK